MPTYKRGSVHIHYEETGSGFPLLVIPGGGLNATISYLSERTPFNPMNVLSDEYRCITMDLRNANGGRSSGPVEIDRPWDAYADDQLGLLLRVDPRSAEEADPGVQFSQPAAMVGATSFNCGQGRRGARN